MNERKRSAIGVVEREYHFLEDRLDAAPDAAFDSAVFAGEGEAWRLRDLIAHLAYWQQLATRAAERMARESVRPGPDERLRTFVGETRGIDELNAAAVTAARGRTVAEVRDELRRAHSRFVEAMREVPEDLLMTGDGPEEFVSVLLVPAVRHLRTHRDHIDAALKEGAKT